MLPGMIIPYAGASVPVGFLNCDGAAVSRTTYAALFLAIGTTYGAGNGSTTFNVPDLRGRAVIGAGTGAGLTPRTRGDVGGAENVGLQASDIPALTVSLDQSSSAGAGNAAVYGDSGNIIGQVTGSTPASSTYPATMSPFGVAQHLIKC